MKLPYRIGQGFDIHAFCDNRPLIIGGVRIDHPRGLAGHSDADVLLHAITDALLGGAGLRDIGYHFPDTDARFLGADSLALLAEAHFLVQQRGYKIGNIDSTIMAQSPKLSPYIDKMILNISDCLSINPSQIAIKAKTMEKLGAIGHEEGIMAEAIVLLLSEHEN